MTKSADPLISVIQFPNRDHRQRLPHSSHPEIERRDSLEIQQAITDVRLRKRLLNVATAKLARLLKARHG